MGDVKSMQVFFIDNQGEWPEGAALVGGIVAWPDKGKYPTAVPLAIATHPNYDGRVVVQGGNRCLIVTFVPGAQDADDIRKSMNGRGTTPVQYRLALDAIVHRLLLAGAAEGSLANDREGTDEVHPLTLLKLLARNSPAEAGVLAAALKAYLPAASDPESFSYAESMLDQLNRPE